MTDLKVLGKKAKEAARLLAAKNTEEKNGALLSMAAALKADADAILKANEKDTAAAKEKGTSEAMIDRLRLTKERIFSISADMEKIVSLPDPVGEVMEAFDRPNGLHIEKVRVPMGVIGMIYESRPNVTADAAALCIKTANAVILKGGSDAIFSNIAICDALRKGLFAAGFPEDAVQLVTDTDRGATLELMRLREYVDLLIPRGGAKLIRYTVENATVPVIERQGEPPRRLQCGGNPSRSRGGGGRLSAQSGGGIEEGGRKAPRLREDERNYRSRRSGRNGIRHGIFRLYSCHSGRKIYR